jgi:predicted dehydrogenase
MSTARVPAMTMVFLGCGDATRTHSRTLARIAPSVRRAYASRDPARARAFAREFGGVASFGSYDAALADASVDIVFVATPPTSHLDLALRALAAGRHVIVEKPPFLRAADVDAVERAARDSGRRAFVAENYPYKPLVSQLREIISAGALGDVRFVQLNALKLQRTANWRDNETVAGGGALFEGGIHWISLLSSLGMRLASIEAHRPGAPAGLDRSVLVVARYATGAVATLHYSWEIPSPLRGLRLSKIFGRDGTATFESNGVFILTSGRRPALYLPGFRDIQGYRAMFLDFFDAIASDHEPRYDLAAARRDLTLIESAYASISTG